MTRNNKARTTSYETHSTLRQEAETRPVGRVFSRPRHLKFQISNLKFLSKNLDDLLHRIGELIDFLARVIKRERGSSGRRDFKKLHHGLSTVMTRADRDAVLIQNRSDVVRVDSLDRE